MISLVIILALGAYLFYLVRDNPPMQIFVGIATAVLYVVWGIIHHAAKKDLHVKVVVEYMLIALIAVVLLLTVLG